MADNVNSSCGSEFYGRITMDADIPTDDINHYKTSYRINNASFRQKLYPIIKNILRRDLASSSFNERATDFFV